jgi:hypothetical protein
LIVVANTKITELTQLTNPVSTDVLPIVDVGADVTRKISIADLLKNASTGTADAPGIAFDGRSRNGIYSPGADQVAISTNGTGRLFVDASGNVGLNASTPNNYGAGYNVFTVNGSTSPVIDLNVGGTRTATFYAFSTNTLIGTQTSTPLQIITNGTEKARITSDGKLGLGSSAPGAKLQISDTFASAGTKDYLRLQSESGIDGCVMRISGTGYPGTTQSAIDLIQNAGTNFQSQIAFSTSAGAGAVERVRITSTGAVGIGTASVSANLHIGDANGKLRIGIDASSQYLDVYRDNATGFTVYNAAQPGTFRAHVWQLGGTEAARIDSSGRLLVGTSSARGNFFNTDFLTSRLQVEDSTHPVISSTKNANDEFPSYLVLAKTRGTGNTIVNSGDSIGAVSFQGNDGSEFVGAAEIVAQVDGTPGTNDMPGRLIFSTTADGASSPTERMRIRNNGEISCYQTGSAALVLRSSQAAGTANSLIVGIHSGTGMDAGGAISFYVYTNGNVQNTNNSYGAISDIKLKENIVDANSQWDDLKALQVRNYNFKEGQTHTQIGLVAQEVELVSPGLVSESPDRDEEGNDLGTVTKSVNYSVLYMKAVKALQEAMERIEVLEQRLTDAGIA